MAERENPPPTSDGARLDFSGAMSYGDYLRPRRSCSARSSRARTDHNELLFIVQHQASELWMKLAIHELAAARDHVRARRPAARVQDALPRGADHGAAQPVVGRPLAR